MTYQDTKKYRENPLNRLKRNARRKVEYELFIGRLKRKTCRVCKKRKTEAHHKDYLKPLQIVWLCKHHHALADKRLRKTTPQKMLAIYLQSSLDVLD